MNPFLDSTVATPRPGASWCRPSRRLPRNRPGRHAATPRASEPRGGAPGGKRPPGPGLRRARQVLRALAFAGSLLLPGAALAVDINTATPEQLLEVKGIGPKMAQVIIEERERGGRFASIDDVSDRVKGIGPKKAAAMQASGLTVGVAELSSASGDGGGRPPAAGAARRNR